MVVLGLLVLIRSMLSVIVMSMMVLVVLRRLGLLIRICIRVSLVGRTLRLLRVVFV